MSLKRLKIAYFIDRIIHGGTELQLVEQINRLNERQVEQELFCLYKSAEHDTLKVKCKVTILDLRKLMSPHCFSTILRLRGYLKKSRFSVVQTYFFDSTFLGVLAGAIAGQVRIINCRRDLGFWYSPRLLFTLRVLNRLSDGVLVNSRLVKESISSAEKLSPSKVQVISNGIDLDAFRYTEARKKASREQFGIENDQRCVGIIANMNREVKRVDLFIRAARYVLERERNVRFLVLGDGCLKSRMVGLALDLGMEEEMLFAGRQVSKHTVLPAMDVGVLSSDSEAMSNAIMEYMAAGLPVVATAVGGNTELVVDGETGFLAPPGDVKQIGESILALLRDEQKRVALGSRGRETVMNFNWPSTIDRYCRYYERLLDS